MKIKVVHAVSTSAVWAQGLMSRDLVLPSCPFLPLLNFPSLIQKFGVEDMVTPALRALEYDNRLKDFGWEDYTYEPLTRFDAPPLLMSIPADAFTRLHMYVASRAEIMTQVVELGLHSSSRDDWLNMNRRALRNHDRFMFFYRNNHTESQKEDRKSMITGEWLPGFQGDSVLTKLEYQARLHFDCLVARQAFMSVFHNREWDLYGIMQTHFPQVLRLPYWPMVGEKYYPCLNYLEVDGEGKLEELTQYIAYAMNKGAESIAAQGVFRHPSGEWCYFPVGPSETATGSGSQPSGVNPPPVGPSGSGSGERSAVAKSSAKSSAKARTRRGRGGGIEKGKGRGGLDLPQGSPDV